MMVLFHQVEGGRVVGKLGLQPVLTRKIRETWASDRLSLFILTDYDQVPDQLEEKSTVILISGLS